MNNHNTHPLPKREDTMKIGCMIRKWDKSDTGNWVNPTRKTLDKQIKTLHKRLKRDNMVITEYSIEKDTSENRYHTHMIIHCKDTGKVENQLSRFIGGTDWVKRDVGINTFNECNGKYGLVHMEEIIDERKYRDYINKNNPLITLI